MTTRPRSNDAATVAEDSSANPIDVLANDTDDGGPKTITEVTQPTNGTVAITGGGTGLTYTPNPNYCNGGDPTDDFTYTLNGGSTATVAVTVDCADDDPTAVERRRHRRRGLERQPDRRARQRHRSTAARRRSPR